MLFLCYIILQIEGVHIISAHTELSAHTITDILNSILDPLVNHSNVGEFVSNLAHVL